jgi:hypothetical protein
MSQAGEVLAVLGDALAGISPIIGGATGAGLSGAARIVRAASALLIKGEDVEAILAKMRQPVKVTLPWEETTPAERPSVKGKP